MKKILVVAVALALCVGVLAAAGCGSTDKAKTYMEQGDALSKQMRSLTNDVTFDATALLADLGVQLSDTGNINPQTITNAANKKIDSVIANGKKAKTEYDKILALNGVEDYKAYAEQRIKAIDSTVAVLDAVKGLLDKIGDPANKKSLKDTSAQWAKSNIRVAVDAVRAYTSWSNAENIRKEKKLGPIEVVEKKPAGESVPASAP
ncbi:MAG TPA: hypothetical protein VIK22_00825 [Candidatus Anoxymicrobiaceae bacterium]